MLFVCNPQFIFSISWPFFTKLATNIMPLDTTAMAYFSAYVLYFEKIKVGL
jgi:hypothetical protein